MPKFKHTKKRVRRNPDPNSPGNHTLNPDDKDAISKEPASKTTKNIGKLLPKHEGYLVLREQGFNQKEASQMVGFTPSNGCLLDRKLNPKYDLTSDKFTRLASKAVKSLIQGKAFGEIEKVKDSTALAAASMVYDRVQPIRGSDSSINPQIAIQVNVYEANGKRE